MDTIKIDRKKTKMIAHRGVSSLERENTVAAFIAAGNRSYYGTECDIHLTKDGKVVISHDDNTKRLAPIDLVIKDSTYQELIQVEMYEIGTNETKPYLKIPTLKEYIDISKKYQKQCIIELKPAFSDIEVNNLLDEIASYEYLNNVIFISFNYDNIVKIRNINKEVRIQYLYYSEKRSDFPPNLIENLKKINCGIDIYYKSISKADVEFFHSHNIEVNVWTVDNPLVASELISWDVDYITTNVLE